MPSVCFFALLLVIMLAVINISVIVFDFGGKVLLVPRH